MTGKTLVIGSTGTIGAPLVKRLAESGFDVRAATRNPTAYAEHSPHIEAVYFDFRDPSRFSEALLGVERIFFLAPASPALSDLTQRLVAEAKRHNIEKIVKVSALGAHRESPMAFARWHGESEDLIRESGINYVFLRPNAFMQNFIRFYSKTIHTQSLFFAPTADAKISYIDARDIAEAAHVLLARDQTCNTEIDLTGPESLTNADAASILSESLGRTIKFMPVTDAEAQQGMRSAGFPDWMVSALTDLYKSYRDGQAAPIRQNYRELTNLPPTPFANFVEDYKYAF